MTNFPELQNQYAIVDQKGYVTNVIMADPDWDIKANLGHVYDIAEVVSCAEYGQAWIRGTWDFEEKKFIAPDVPAEE